MSQVMFDFVIPLFRVRWNTRAVMEGLTAHYQPRSIHILTPASEAAALRELAQEWETAPLYVHEEETFFVESAGLTKDEICAELDLGESLYTPGWFYQQILKLGAPDGIAGLSEWYAVWDSDLLPAATWPLIEENANGPQYKFALLQHNQYGNPKIVSTWDKWICDVLGVRPLTDEMGTFIPHHMWFKQSHLQSFKRQLGRYFESDTHWAKLMMRSANQFGTFSEYWAYISWVATEAPEDVAFYPYAAYGETTERFFDDGTGLFSKELRSYLETTATDDFSPSFQEVDEFIRATYPPDPLPSSLAFESSPRHLKKNEATMHIEEKRSRWNPRMVEQAVGVS